MVATMPSPSWSIATIGFRAFHLLAASKSLSEGQRHPRPSVAHPEHLCFAEYRTGDDTQGIIAMQVGAWGASGMPSAWSTRGPGGVGEPAAMTHPPRGHARFGCCRCHARAPRARRRVHLRHDGIADFVVQPGPFHLLKRGHRRTAATAIGSVGRSADGHTVRSPATTVRLPARLCPIGSGKWGRISALARTASASRLAGVGVFARTARRAPAELAGQRHGPQMTPNCCGCGRAGRERVRSSVSR